MAGMELKISFDGSLRIARPQAVSGLNLFAQVEGIAGQFVVMEFMANDQQAFWDCWRALGGDQQGLAYEGGEKFVAPFAPVKDHSATIKLVRRRWFERLLDWLFPCEDDDG